MESPYQRLVVIPEMEYMQFKLNSPSKETVIAKEQKQTLPDDQWLMLQSNIETRERDKITTPLAQPPPLPSPIWVEQSIARLPKQNQKRALQLLEFLKSRNIGWNIDGEIITSDGETLNGSNIVDLIQYATMLRRRKSMDYPHAMQEFNTLLTKLNAPKSILGPFATAPISPPLTHHSTDLPSFIPYK